MNHRDPVGFDKRIEVTEKVGLDPDPAVFRSPETWPSGRSGRAVPGPTKQTKPTQSDSQQSRPATSQTRSEQLVRIFRKANLAVSNILKNLLAMDKLAQGSGVALNPKLRAAIEADLRFPARAAVPHPQPDMRAGNLPENVKSMPKALKPQGKADL